MAINRLNNRFFNRAFRLQVSTPPAIEPLSFASADSCTESTAEHISQEPSSPEPSSLEQAMIPQQALMKDALSPHLPSPLPADADATATGTDILCPAGLQPQPVEWLRHHRRAAGTPLDFRIGADGNFDWTALSNLTPGDLLAPRPTSAGLPKRKFAPQWLRDCLQPGSQTQGSIEIAGERDDVCIATLRRAKFDIGVRSSKDGNQVSGGGLALSGGLPPAGQRGKMLKLIT
jgi:hypothetical protein